MRNFDTYRAHLRNALRIVRDATDHKTLLRYWKRGDAWKKANFKAKLAMRAEQCKGARAYLIQNLQEHGTTLGLRAIPAILHAYWSGVKPRSRVVSRILRETAPVNLAHA